MALPNSAPLSDSHQSSQKQKDVQHRKFPGCAPLGQDFLHSQERQNLTEHAVQRSCWGHAAGIIHFFGCAEGLRHFTVRLIFFQSAAGCRGRGGDFSAAVI